MSIQFDFYENPSSMDEDGKPTYHARPVMANVVDTDTIVRMIHERSSLSPGDILSTLSNLSQVLSEKLQEGRRVHIDGIGYFSVSLGCTTKIITQKDMRADRVDVKAIKYRADKHLKSDLGKVKARRTKLKVHSAKLSTAEIDERLDLYFKENPVLTRMNFQYLCQMAQVTAIRHIQRLLKEGKIKNINTSRNPIYVPGDNVTAS